MRESVVEKKLKSKASTSPNSWVERGFGMMKNAWKDIDPSKEIEKMRNEW